MKRKSEMLSEHQHAFVLKVGHGWFWSTTLVGIQRQGVKVVVTHSYTTVFVMMYQCCLLVIVKKRGNLTCFELMELLSNVIETLQKVVNIRDN